MPTLESDWIHIANLVLGFIALMLLFGRTSKRWSEFPREVGLLHLLAINLLFGLLVVSSKQLIVNEGVSFDSIVITIVKVATLVILWNTRTTLYRTGTRHVDGGSENTNRTNEDSDHPDRDIEA